MLTPLFELSQDTDFLFLKIKAPFAKIPETEFDIDGKSVLFSSPPYFLRLFLPCEVTENGKEEAKFDSESGFFAVKVPKKNEGENFPGLDMVTRLLTPPGREHATELIIGADAEKQEGAEEEDAYEWCHDQTPSERISSIDKLSRNSDGYGFGQMRSNVISTLKDEISMIFDIENADDLSNQERLSLKYEAEDGAFSSDHYLADLYSTEEIEPLLEFELPKSEKLTSEETDRLKEIPKKTFPPFAEKEMDGILYSLVDILFAYAYDVRTTLAEPNVESSWTISKLSGTLSWLVSYDTLRSSLLSSYRRSLIFPLHRNFHLCQTLQSDVVSLLRQGKIGVLKSLLDIHSIFNNGGDFRYIFNELYVTDYCVWIQYLNEETLESLATELQSIKLRKDDAELDLDELELSAKLATLDVAPGNDTSEKYMTNEEMLKLVRKNAQLDSDDEDEGEE